MLDQALGELRGEIDESKREEVPLTASERKKELLLKQEECSMTDPRRCVAAAHAKVELGAAYTGGATVVYVCNVRVGWRDSGPKRQER